MGGFFGIASKKDAMLDAFFGVDYHSHLGARRAGMAAYDAQIGLQRVIHNIENSPFRTKFEHIRNQMQGTSVIGCISDTDPEPVMIRSNLGNYAICMIGRILNSEELIDQYLSFSGGHFEAMTGGRINNTELAAALINQKSDFVEGIRFAQNSIKGTASILLIKDDGTLIAARDKYGRLPVQIGKDDNGFAVAFESFSYHKLGFEDYKELGPGEIVSITPDNLEVLSPALKKKKICAFLWSYYGYPTSQYEGINVEAMRYRNGGIMAKQDEKLGRAEDVDYVGGVPDSGIAHAIGYANESHKAYARAFIKYSPTWSRSFLPANQEERSKVAKMKQIPVMDFIKDKKLLVMDDSVVRGTQLKETVDFLYESGAKEVHMRSACPPVMYGCKYLNFSRMTSDDELLCRRIIEELEGEEGLRHIEEYSDGSTERGKKLREVICEKFNFSSMNFQSLEGLIEAIGLEPCELCTYCWNGKE